jgi:hypothetical protein
MASIAEIRQKYPQYADLSDDQLAEGLHRKHYADMPYAEFRTKIGLGNGASGSYGRGASGSWSDPRLADKSGLEKYRMGGKIGFGELALGAKQLFGKATEADVDAYRAQNAGLVEDPAVRSGNVSAHVATSLPAMLVPGGQTILGSAALGGAFGGIQPVGTGESRVHNALTGAAVSGGVTAGLKTAGRVIQPIRNANNAGEQAAVDTLRGEGVQLSVGQQTGSGAVQGVERALRNNPYTGPAMADAGRRSAESFTRRVLRTIGETADGATPEVLGRARARIGQTMDDIYSRYLITPSSKAMAEVDQLEQSARRRLGADNGIAATAADIRDHLAQNGGKMDGKFFQKIRRDLAALESKADTAEIAREFREGLDDAFHQVASKADKAALATARSQWRNMQAIADTADTTNRGLVSPSALAQRLKSGKHTKNAFRFGRGDAELERLARSGSTLADRFPNSGTAYHAGAQLVAPSIVGGASYAQDGDFDQALKLAAATYGLPKVAAAALTNPAAANYLARGIPLPPAANQLSQYLLRIAPPATTALVTGP